MDVRTHESIDRELCGEVTDLGDGRATTRFTATSRMAVDDRGLVHGGFVFGLVDHAAMVAVNDPLVVLGGAEVRFVAPVRVGDEVVAIARVVEQKGKKRILEVSASVDGRAVATGTLTAFVLEAHVLDG
jgi:uncharacterized protein (TIGR00369 family)